MLHDEEEIQFNLCFRVKFCLTRLYSPLSLNNKPRVVNRAGLIQDYHPHHYPGSTIN